jgi:hypothetical protein
MMPKSEVIVPDPAKWDKVRGYWEVGDVCTHRGLLHTPSVTEIPNRLLVYPREIADGEISATVRLLDTLDDNSGRILIRYIDEGRFYSAGIGGYKRAYIINRQEGLGKSQLLVSYGTDADLEANKEYKILVRFGGQRIQLFVNEHLVVSVDDEAYSKGRFGLKTFGSTQVEFRDVAALEHEWPYPYDVVISFAGEDRLNAEQLASEMTQRSLRIFYDRLPDVKADLWGKNLVEHLQDVYRKRALFCIALLSGHYAEKPWPSVERAAAEARALEDREYILPIRLDETDVPGILPTTGYIDLRTTTPAEIVTLLEKKLASLRRRPRDT